MNHRSGWRGRRALWLALPVLATALVAPAAFAQAPAIPPLPGGDGVIRGQLDHPDGPKAAAGAAVVLYGLASDGAPGVREAAADESGRFRFDDVSTATGAVYLVGVRHRGIPFFGPRVGFEPGRKEIDVRVAVSDPTDDTSGVSVAESTLQLEWTGTALQIVEAHRLTVDGQRVVLVAPEARAGATPAFEMRLPEDTEGFEALPPASDDAFTRDGRTLRFWGPIYPGEQQLRFAYRLPVTQDAEGAGGETRLRHRGAAAAGAFDLLVPAESGIVVGGDGLEATGSETIGERSFRRFAFRPASASDDALRIRVPGVARDAERVTLELANFWLELDDTALTANAELRLRTGPGPQVVGTRDSPVLVIPLPPRAELLGVSGTARELGATEAEGGVALLGPVPPGERMVALRFRLPTSPDGIELPLRVPLEAPVVNVLVADTGLDITSDRLHRRRPFASGTRTYLHREAYRVAADETVRIELRPIDRAGFPPFALAGGAALAMLAGTAFLVAPLLRHLRTSEADDEERENPWAARRAAVIQDIRDLDHDYETGKIDGRDHDELRERLRAEAIELLRREEASEAARAPTGKPSGVAAAAPAELCPACAKPTRKDWQFCSHCGAALAGGSPSA